MMGFVLVEILDLWVVGLVRKNSVFEYVRVCMCVVVCCFDVVVLIA